MLGTGALFSTRAAQVRAQEDKLPLEVIMPDSKRDELDEKIKQHISVRAPATQGCHNFHADKSETGCASLLTWHAHVMRTSCCALV